MRPFSRKYLKMIMTLGRESKIYSQPIRAHLYRSSIKGRIFSTWNDGRRCLIVVVVYLPFVKHFLWLNDEAEKKASMPSNHKRINHDEKNHKENF